MRLPIRLPLRQAWRDRQDNDAAEPGHSITATFAFDRKYE
jgi:hypothetical protein